MQLLIQDLSRDLRRTVPMGDSMLLGSGDDCDVQLPGEGVRERHCRIEAVGDGHRVMAFQADPGVEVNGRSLRVSPLRPGDVLRIGSFQLVVLPEGTEVVTTGAPAVLSAGVQPGPQDRELLERLEERRRIRRRHQRTSSLVMVVVLLIGLGGLAFLLKPLLEKGGDVPPGYASVERPLFEVKRASGEGRFDEAAALLDALERESLDPRGREAVRSARSELETTRGRYERARGEIEDALRLLDLGDVERARVAMERVVKGYADLGGVRDLAARHLSDMRAAGSGGPADAGDVWPRLLDDAARAELESLHAGEQFGEAWILLQVLRASTAEEEEELAAWRERVFHAADRAGLEYYRIAEEFVREGRVVHALNVLCDEGIDNVRRTPIWYDLLERADEIEDLVDAKVPEVMRPVARLKHARRRPTGVEPRLQTLIEAGLLAELEEEARWIEEEMRKPFVEAADAAATDAEEVAGSPAATEPEAELDPAEGGALVAELLELLGAESWDPDALAGTVERGPRECAEALARELSGWNESAGPEVAAELGPLIESREELARRRERALALLLGEAPWDERQGEYEEAVQAVREVWGREDRGAPEPRIVLTGDAEKALPRIRILGDLLALTPHPRGDPSLLLACIPADTRVVTVRTLAADVVERRQLEEDLRIEIDNKSLRDGPSSSERQMISTVNNYRGLLGVPLLRFDPELQEAARLHAAWMQAYGKVAEIESEAGQEHPRDRAAKVGASHWSGDVSVGGSPSARTVFKDLLDRDVVIRCLLFADHRSIAVAETDGFWAIVFGGESEFTDNL